MLAIYGLILDSINQFEGCCSKREIGRLKQLQIVKQISHHLNLMKSSVLLSKYMQSFLKHRAAMVGGRNRRLVAGGSWPGPEVGDPCPRAREKKEEMEMRKGTV